MIPYPVTFAVPDAIARGIAAGMYKIGAGGVVQEVGTGRVVIWLRPALEQVAKVAVSRPLLGGLSALAAAPLAVKVGAAIAVAAGIGYLGYRLGQYVSRRREAAGEARGACGDAMAGAPPVGVPSPECVALPSMPRLTDDARLAKAFNMVEHGGAADADPFEKTGVAHPADGAA